MIFNYLFLHAERILFYIFNVQKTEFLAKNSQKEVSLYHMMMTKEYDNEYSQ